MEWWQILLLCLSPFVGADIKDRKLRLREAFEKAQAGDRLRSSEKYATWDQHNKLCGKVDNHGERIARLEAGRAPRMPNKEGESNAQV